MYPRIDIRGYPHFFADTDRIYIWFCMIIWIWMWIVHSFRMK